MNARITPAALYAVSSGYPEGITEKEAQERYQEAQQELYAEISNDPCFTEDSDRDAWSAVEDFRALWVAKSRILSSLIQTSE